MSKVKIPKQLFVVSEKRVEREYQKPDYSTYTETITNLGFLHPHEPGLAADDKRKKTQMEWAYNGILEEDPSNPPDAAIWQTVIYKRGNDWWRRGNSHEYTAGGLVYTPFDEPIAPEYAPRVWDNVPLSGFKILDTVNRYRGNKLFKVLDPRGVEFEVTVAALFSIIESGCIEKGIIKEPCIWKGNKSLILAS